MPLAARFFLQGLCGVPEPVLLACARLPVVLGCSHGGVWRAVMQALAQAPRTPGLVQAWVHLLRGFRPAGEYVGLPRYLSARTGTAPNPRMQEVQEVWPVEVDVLAGVHSPALLFASGVRECQWRAVRAVEAGAGAGPECVGCVRLCVCVFVLHACERLLGACWVRAGCVLVHVRVRVGERVHACWMCVCVCAWPVFLVRGCFVCGRGAVVSMGMTVAIGLVV